ncbi:minor tail protein [Mycobacterium phage MrMiyagi]|uniref:Minor tail protein n=1 Tax=Mycobacterium phage MrMiyagi TaxID=2762395 RepID=A0A7G8LPR8_9CAUD|nr:minor tail protein [Mycobacterium phage MrMiyagi]
MPARFKITGLQSNTAVEITARAIDRTGNPSDTTTIGPVSTLEHTSEDPMLPEHEAAIDNIINATMEVSGAPGVIFGMSGPLGRLTKAYGRHANVNRPLTIDDHYRIASSTKLFVSLAFWMQFEQGRISLDDTLDMYVSGVPNGNLITIKNLMDMRSGIADFAQNLLVQIIFTLFPTWGWTDAEKDALGFIKGTPMFQPGTNYHYTNGNTILLGMCLRAVDPEHRHIKTIIQEDILNPLGMTETSWPKDAVIPLPRAADQKVNPELFGAGGAMVSTVTDMLKFGEALRDHTLISEDTFDFWMNDLDNYWRYAGPFINPPPNYFGYGLFTEITGTWRGHNGIIDGWIHQVGFDTVSGSVLVVSENKLTSKPAVAAGYTVIFHDIAAELLPGSMDDQDIPVPPELQ